MMTYTTEVSLMKTIVSKNVAALGCMLVFRLFTPDLFLRPDRIHAFKSEGDTRGGQRR